MGNNQELHVKMNGEEYTFSKDYVEDLTRQAEQGNSLSNELNSMDWDERAALAALIDQTNERHRKAEPLKFLHDVQLTFDKDSAGAKHLIDIKTVNPLGSDWNPFNPRTRDLYDLPQSVTDINVWRALPESLQKEIDSQIVQKVLDYDRQYDPDRD